MSDSPIIQAQARPVKYWHMLEDGRIQCDMCPRFCKLREGQRGLCFVRGRLNDGMVSTWALQRLLR
jgi:pyruvate formate lyase activating enzyme